MSLVFEREVCGSARNSAVACGRKFEHLHFGHTCNLCKNQGILKCITECYFNINCCFEPIEQEVAND